MVIRNQQPAHMYGLSLLQNGGRDIPTGGGGAEIAARALQPIVAAMLMKYGDQQQKAEDKNYGDALLGYQQNVQNELIPTSINPTPPVQMGEDASMRDYSGVVQKAAPGEAMANALLGVKNPDAMRDLQPMVMQQQMADLSRADDRAFSTGRNLQNQRFQRGTQENQQQFATQERLGGQDFAGSQNAAQIAAQADTAAANREAAAALAGANRESANARTAQSAGATVEAARIRAGAAQGRPMPPAVQRQEDDDLDAIGLATAISDDFKSFRDKIQGDKLNLGPGTNVMSRTWNWLGMGGENSRNFADFKAMLEKSRNASLVLNKGVQTEGDATRAWNELFENLNDEGVVMQRLQAIEGINSRAAQLKAQNVDIRRTRNNQQPFDWTGFKVPSSPYADPAGGGAQPQAGGLSPEEQAELDQLRSRFGKR